MERLRRRFPARIAVFLAGILLALILAELLLRGFQAVPLRVRGTRLQLPANLVMKIRNPGLRGLEPEITHSRNALGLRGEDPPADLDRRLSLLAVGGSTTECFYLSDGKTWTAVLGRCLAEDFSPLWINNAGLDGHSTFGHAVLLGELLPLLRPKVVLLLVGANELGLERPREDYDQRLIDQTGGEGPSPCSRFFRPGNLVNYLAGKLDLVALAVNIRRAWRARDLGVEHQDQDLDRLPRVPASPGRQAAVLREHRERYLPAYRDRLDFLLGLLRRYGVFPVLVTQPALFGPGCDDPTGIDLGTLAYGDGNAAEQWEILESYNGVVRKMGRDTGILVIDLAARLPKSSRYFYDWYHVTGEGAEETGRILCEGLRPFLAERFPEYLPRSP